MFDAKDEALVLYLARCTLAKKPGKNNWVEEDAVNGLPEYICRIARAIHRDGSHSVSQSIAIAVSRAKAWARGQGGVTAKTRAKAAKAVAEWESKKKAAKLDNKVKMSNSGMLELASYNVDDIRRQYREGQVTPGTHRWVREMWSDYLIVAVESEDSMKFFKVPYTVDKTGKATFGQEVEVKQAFVELSNLTSRLTDAQLETATLIPCTEKHNRSLLETVRLSKQLKMEEQQLLKLSAPVIELASRTFSPNSREKMAGKGTAMSDGSYPIPDRDALRRAIQSYGRAKPEDRPKVKAHILKRARALKAMDMIPESWK